MPRRGTMKHLRDSPRRNASRDIGKALRSNLTGLERAKFMDVEFDNVATHYEDTILDILDVNGKPTATLLGNAAVMAWPKSQVIHLLHHYNCTIATHYHRHIISTTSLGTPSTHRHYLNNHKHRVCQLTPQSFSPLSLSPAHRHTPLPWQVTPSEALAFGKQLASCISYCREKKKSMRTGARLAPSVCRIARKLGDVMASAKAIMGYGVGERWECSGVCVSVVVIVDGEGGG